MTTRNNLVRQTSLYTMAGLSDPRLMNEVSIPSGKQKTTSNSFIVSLQRLFAKNLTGSVRVTPKIYRCNYQRYTQQSLLNILKLYIVCELLKQAL